MKLLKRLFKRRARKPISPAGSAPDPSQRSPDSDGRPAPARFETPWDQDCRALAESGLFDAKWYRSNYPNVPAGEELAYFLNVGWRLGHSPGQDFESPSYLARYPGVARAGMNPVLHYIRHGRSEGRSPLPHSTLHARPFSDPWLRARLEPFLLDTALARSVIAASRAKKPWPRLHPGDRVDVYIHSAGNIFMREIAELVHAGLNAAGLESRLLTEDHALACVAGRETASETRLIVAPHEFFILPLEGPRVPAEWGHGAIMLNVEQLHTKWFREGLASLQRASAVLDINLTSAAFLCDLGLAAAYLPLGYVEGGQRFDASRPLPDIPALETLEPAIRQTCPDPLAPLAERPIDLFFIGYLSPRRAGILQRMADRLSRWRCHFALVDGDSPQVSGVNALLETEATLGLVQRSKIVLNLHQSDEPFFEWHRIVLQGIWGAALVVSEPVSAQDSFTAGDHFIEAPLEELADVIDWILGTPAGQEAAERMRRAAHAHLVETVRLDATLRDLFLAETGQGPDGSGS